MGWFVESLVVGQLRGMSGNDSRRPYRLHVGEALDWWRVEHIDRGRLLRLRAEMNLPGVAWLEPGVEPAPGQWARY